LGNGGQGFVSGAETMEGQRAPTREWWLGHGKNKEEEAGR
jgi:hypothetical protein